MRLEVQCGILAGTPVLLAVVFQLRQKYCQEICQQLAAVQHNCIGHCRNHAPTVRDWTAQKPKHGHSSSVAAWLPGGVTLLGRSPDCIHAPVARQYPPTQP
eukprot:GHUV01042544.1.p1 GENE.GHUV01042544.1~~GHUV01042544.1.p1  ORF type:complete len:101 (+),score=14.78 GHUV01042544.1:507-809(+)